ncbi:MAG: hypothetical protein K0Q79_2709 [Flavipsychrobacter sp.]|nr:hypothetical protein [Flavipsychrobacter sp.]
MDGAHNLYIATLDHRIRKVTSAGIITTIAGTGVSGYSGDDGLATLAKLNSPYGLFADFLGNVYFADMGNNRIRRVDAATGVITTIAGNGISGFNGDNGPATNAELHNPDNAYLDSFGNVFIGEQWKIRKIDIATGIITTFAGTGIIGGGGHGDGGAATAARINYASTMSFDKNGNFYFADRGGSRIRKISTIGIISTVVGTSYGYSGDGGPATVAQVNNPISFAFDSLGNMVIGDNGNNVFRLVNTQTGIIYTIAGDTSTHATALEGTPATSTQMHPEFIYLDQFGNIYYSNWGAQVRKITNYYTTMARASFDQILLSRCSNIIIYPNPTHNEITITTTSQIENIAVLNMLGEVVASPWVAPKEKEVQLNVRHLSAGIYFVKVNGMYAGRFAKE